LLQGDLDLRGSGLRRSSGVGMIALFRRGLERLADLQDGLSDMVQIKPGEFPLNRRPSGRCRSL
jgi:hypothetical protein